MSKKLIYLGIALMMLFSIAGLSACDLTDLAAYKTTAKAGLETYAQESDYTPQNWTVVLGLVDTGKASVDAAASTTAVDTAVTTAKQGIDAVPKEIKMNNVFPSVLEEFCLEDFTQEFFENNKLILVPFFHGYQIYEYLYFYTAFAENGKLNFLIENAYPYSKGDAAGDDRVFAVIIPNEVLNKYEIGETTVFKTYDFSYPDGYEQRTENCREWLKELEWKSIKHTAGYIFDQYGVLAWVGHDIVTVPSIAALNDLLETARWGSAYWL